MAWPEYIDASIITLILYIPLRWNDSSSLLEFIIYLLLKPSYHHTTRYYSINVPFSLVSHILKNPNMDVINTLTESISYV